MFVYVYVTVMAVAIDRLCSKLRINSTPWQFASLGLAALGEASAVLVLHRVFPRPDKWPGSMPNDIMGWIRVIVGGCSGFSGSLLVYLYLRSKLLTDPDHDDEAPRPVDPSRVADIDEPRHRDNLRPE